ncbi:MAG: MATE family efflux transporter, partial [Burkholderiales bacterium]
MMPSKPDGPGRRSRAGADATRSGADATRSGADAGIAAAAAGVGHLRVLRLAVPIILSNLSVPLVGLVDTAVMGRLPDPAFLGAVALGAVLFSFLYWGFGFLRMGTTGLVAREFGRGAGAAARELLLRNLALAAVFGLALLALQWPIGQLARWLMPASPAVESAMLEYYGIRIWAAPAVLANYVLMGMFIAMQRTGYALLAQLVLNLGNAALSVTFVIGLGFGISGVAAASLIAEYAALACGLVLVRIALGSLPGQWRPQRMLEVGGYRALLVVN